MQMQGLTLIDMAKNLPFLSHFCRDWLGAAITEITSSPISQCTQLEKDPENFHHYENLNF